MLAVVLAVTGAFVWLGLRSALDETIDDGLRTRAGDVLTIVRRDLSTLDDVAPTELEADDDTFAQVLGAHGRVLATTAADLRHPVLGEAELTQAREQPAFFVRRVGGREEDWRVLAAEASGGRIVVVGASLEDRDETLAELLTQLLIGLPLALALASLAGYGVAAAALRPVESMRRRAAAISGASAGARLPIPPAEDEIRRLGETLNGMLERLEAALTRERTFVADASHELRTPLALLKAELELALRRPRAAEELERVVRSAADETDRLTQLAEDLLVLARSDQGELPLRPESLRVREVLEGVRERFVGRAATAGRSIAVDAPPDLAVEGDRLRLEQALGNLVDNALRHGDGAIALSGSDEDGRVVLRVTDEGPGVPAEFLERAFERFARADAARTGGGAGLGLAIVDVIARAHSGRAVALNRPAGGAEVRLELPRPDRAADSPARV